MTPRERVHLALQFQDTDIVPYQVNFTSDARKNLASYYGDENFIEGIGNHLAILSHRKNGPWTEVAPGHLRDEWGVVWNRTIDKDIGVVETLPLPEPTLAEFEFPDPTTSPVYGVYLEAG